MFKKYYLYIQDFFLLKSFLSLTQVMQDMNKMLPKPPLTPGMPKTWHGLNIPSVKTRINTASILHLQQEQIKLERRKKSILYPFRDNMPRALDEQMYSDFEQSSHDFSAKNIYSFIQSSSNISFQQQQQNDSIASTSPTKFLLGNTKKKRPSTEMKNMQIFSYFQFQNKAKLDHSQTMKKLMRLNLNSSKKTNNLQQSGSSFSKFNSDSTSSEYRINHFFPKLVPPKNTKNERAINESKMFNIQKDTSTDEILANFEDISLIYLKQNEIDVKDKEKELKDLNSESVFIDPRNLIEQPLLLKRKKGSQIFIDPQAHSSQITFSQLPTSSMNNLLASSTASLIANRKPRINQTINLTTDHEKKSFQRYASTLDMKTSSQIKQIQEPVPPPAPVPVPAPEPAAPVVAPAATSIEQPSEFEDTFYKSTFLISEDNDNSAYIPVTPKNSTKKRVHFLNNM